MSVPKQLCLNVSTTFERTQSVHHQHPSPTRNLQRLSLPRETGTCWSKSPSSENERVVTWFNIIQLNHLGLDLVSSKMIENINVLRSTLISFVFRNSNRALIAFINNDWRVNLYIHLQQYTVGPQNRLNAQRKCHIISFRST